MSLRIINFMTSYLLKKVEKSNYPAAIVSIKGEIMAANEQGKILLDKTFTFINSLRRQLEGRKSFEFYLQSDRKAKGTFYEEESVFLIEWQTVSEPETRLAMFKAVSRSVNSSLILEEIFEALGEVLWSFIPYETGTIVILDESQNSTKVIVSLEGNGNVEIRGDNNIFAGYDVLIDDLLKKPVSKIILPPFPQSFLTHNACEQVIIVPLTSKGLVIGFIGLSGNGYTPIHLQRLEDISAQLAVAIENARLYWQTQTQAGQEFLINQITKAIRQSLEINDILYTTAQEIGKVMGLSRCLIQYWGYEDNILENFEYAMPGIPMLSDPVSFAAFEKELFAGRSSLQDQYNPFILNDVRGFYSQKALLDKEFIKSLAVFPILFKDATLVGTINLHQCDTYRSWLGEDIDLLKAIAEHVAVALYQANLFQEKEQQRKQLENTLKELQQTQMHLVQSEKMAVLGQFVAGIAHEINTPLGTLISNDDTVQRCLEQMISNDEKTDRYRSVALDLLRVNQMASDRIMEIVRNLRNFARLDESDLKQTDIHTGLESTLLLINSAIRSTIKIAREYGDVPVVECFPGLLNQVFMNILVNAAHSIEGNGQIGIKTFFDPDRQEVSIAVTDTGKGILPENLSRIFDPGFTTKGVGVGTGLGLALCYKIMEKHHGRIEVESEVNKGTTMTVTLPVRQK